MTSISAADRSFISGTHRHATTAPITRKPVYTKPVLPFRFPASGLKM